MLREDKERKRKEEELARKKRERERLEAQRKERKERRERELQEAVRKAEEEQKLHQQQEEVVVVVYDLKAVYFIGMSDPLPLWNVHVLQPQARFMTLLVPAQYMHRRIPVYNKCMYMYLRHPKEFVLLYIPPSLYLCSKCILLEIYVSLNAVTVCICRTELNRGWL